MDKGKVLEFKEKKYMSVKDLVERTLKNSKDGDNMIIIVIGEDDTMDYGHTAMSYVEMIAYLECVKHDFVEGMRL